MRCKKCGHYIDHSTGRCSCCGLQQWGVSGNPEQETATTKLEMWGVRATNSLRRMSNRVATFEHKGLVALLVLAVLAIVGLTAVSSCLRG